MNAHATSRDWQTRIRLWAAWVMLAYQLVHMGYYGTGLVSADMMEGYNGFLALLWPLVYFNFVAILIHMTLGLWKLYRRHTLRLPWWEWSQISLGLLLPFLIIPNNLANFAMTFLFGIRPNYVDTVLLTYPSMAWRYVAMATIIALHAQIGVHALLRMRRWYPRVRWLIVLVFTLIPLGSLTGYLKGGQDLYREYQAGRLAPDDAPHTLTPDQQAFLKALDADNTLFFGGLYGLLFGARWLRLRVRAKDFTVRVEYPDGRVVKVLPATTVLEASRIGGLPHASICGGRGRCTTCRVRVEAGGENLSPLGERELKALQRIGAADDLRLACQAEALQGSVKVTPLLPAETRSVTARKETKYSVGRDVEMAVMFADLRGFTQLSESKFPYDVVYILNSYFENMGRVIVSHGGKVDKFIGDGILAYFGLEQDARTACLAAVKAAYEMAQSLGAVNEKLAHVLPGGLALGMALHFGDVILGEIGFENTKQLTIIGDTVNTASRLEGLNKRAESQLVLSTTVAARAGLDLSALRLVSTTLRGKNEPLRVYVVRDVVKDLGGVLER